MVKKDTCPIISKTKNAALNDSCGHISRSCNEKCVALIDPRSKFNLVREDFYNGLRRPRLQNCCVGLIGFGCARDTSKINPLGHFKETILIDNDEFVLDFYVVPIGCMDFQLIVGEELCLHARFNRDGLQVCKMPRQEGRRK